MSAAGGRAVDGRLTPLVPCWRGLDVGADARLFETMRTSERLRLTGPLSLGDGSGGPVLAPLDYGELPEVRARGLRRRRAARPLRRCRGPTRGGRRRVHDLQPPLDMYERGHDRDALSARLPE